MAPKAELTPIASQTNGLVRLAHSRVGTSTANRISSPPMVGVPALTWWRSGPTSRMLWPMERRCSCLMNHGASSRQSRKAVSTAPAVRKVM